MNIQFAIVFVAFVSATIVGNVSPCMYPRDWKELPLRDRITAANTVILGYVEALYPSKETTTQHTNNTLTLLPRYYTAKIVLKCAFHGKYSKIIQPAFNLTTVNTGSSCRATNVKKHHNYIFLLDGSLSSPELAPMEVNYQSAVVEISEPSMEVIRIEFGYEIIKHDNTFICKASTTPTKKLKRMDPAMVIGEENLDANNDATIITHNIGLIYLTATFLIYLLF